MIEQNDQAVRMLMIGHMARWKDRRTSALLSSKGCAITSVCPAAGEPLPGDLAPYQALVVLGGPQNVCDADRLEDAYLKDEMRIIEAFLHSGRPLLGICLGAQLMAATLGADVGEHPDGLAEIGYYPVRPTAAGSRLIPDPLQVYHWHYQGFALPHGAELLARGDRFPNQAFRYGASAYGLQFHPDTTPEEIDAWTLLLEAQLRTPGAHARTRQMEEIALYDASLSQWFGAFLDHWLTPVRDLSSLRQSPRATSY